MNRFERLSTRELGSKVTRKMGAVTVAVAAVTALSQGNAEAREFNVPGTGHGMPGVGFVPGEIIHYPAVTPGLEDMHGSVMNGSTALNTRIASTPETDQVNGFSQGAVLVHETLSTPAAAGVSETTLVGDPCNPSGIMTQSQEARHVANMDCSPIAPHIEQTIIRNTQDPIANFHYPTNAIDFANMLAGYEVAHPYNLPRNTYDVQVNDTGRVEYIDMIMHDSALKVALGRRGIFLAPEQEQAVKDAIPQGFGPSNAPAPELPGRTEVATEVAIEETPATYDEPVGQGYEQAEVWTNPVAETITTNVDTTAEVIVNVAPQFESQVEATVRDIHIAVENAQQQAKSLLAGILPR